MRPNAFGGSWTERKLAVIEKYLNAYLTIMRGNERARHFTTSYVDAFAGSGYRQRRGHADLVATSLGDDYDATGLIAGSAVRALKLAVPFDQYMFIERDARALGNLKQHVPRRLESRVTFVEGDANIELQALCVQWNKGDERAVVFLDPYGLQINWNTLEQIANTKAMDLWMLFPVGIGVNRLLTTQREPPEEWAKTLDRIFGTNDWREAFYRTDVQEGLFGTHQSTIKTSNLVGISEFMLDRLRTCFAHVCDKYLVLTNSNNSPMFILLFAAAAPKGGESAVKIAKSIIMKELGSA